MEFMEYITENGTYSSGLHHYLIYGWNPNEHRRVSK